MNNISPADRVKLALSVLQSLPNWQVYSQTYGSFTDHLEDLIADLEQERTHRLQS